MLIGNKCDLSSQRVVAVEQAIAYAESQHIEFMETSAMQSINVDKAFETMASQILDRLTTKAAKMKQFGEFARAKERNSSCCHR